jgi:hypothetical protein
MTRLQGDRWVGRGWTGYRAAAALVFGAVVVTISACGAASPRVGQSARRTTTTTTTTTTKTTTASQPAAFVTPELKYGTGQVGAPDPTTTVPTETGSRPIDPSNDAGQAVIIDTNGYLVPEWLVANVGLPITWTNLSGVAQQVVFNDAPVRSAIIAAGGTFTWTSPGYAVSLRYHTAAGHQAKLTLQNPDTNS